MKKIKKTIILIIGGLILGGCTAKGPQFKKFEIPSQGKANIYIYRKAQFFGDALFPDIHITNTEDKILPRLLLDGYIKEEVDPGTYLIWAKTEARNQVIIKAKKNKNYCIQHYISWGFFIGHPQFELQSLLECEPAIKTTRLSEKKE